MPEHALLPASGAHRWRNCPGSIAACAGIEAPPSEYADLGTSAHAAAKIALEEKLEARDLIGQEIEGVVVDHEMTDALDLYTEVVREGQQPNDVLLVEQRVDLAKWGPPTPMFGTADAIRYQPDTRRLLIFDLKFGQGVPVEAENNDQLLYYAGGAVHAVPGPVAEVELVIVQPRAQHRGGPIRREEIDALELVERVADLLDDARRALDPDAPLTPGSHCKFCPASPTSPALRQHALTVAQVEFDVAPLAPPDPATLEPAEIGRLLEQADLVELWIRSLRAHAHRELERGFEIPGWKLVQKRAVRRWHNENEATEQPEALGLSADEIFARALRSPAQVEKVLGRKRKGEIGDLIVAESSGTTLVPENDQRQAIASRSFGLFAEIEP